MSDVGLFLLLLAGLCVVVVVIRFLAWLTDVLEAGGPRAYMQRSAGRYIMSRDDPQDRPKQPVAAPVVATLPEAGQPIATPGNADNAELPGNVVAGPIPNEARDIIRMQAKAEAVAQLLKTAKMTNKAEAIETVFNCSRTSRAGSTYQQALLLVDALIERYPQRTPDQEQTRQEMGLA